MKRILSLLSLLLLITSCDDGNLTVDVIDFSDVAAVKCPNKETIYKIKDAVMLVLEIPSITFVENETPDGEPIILQINSTNKVTYRKYNGIVSAENICPNLPSGFPSLIEQWTAKDGRIEITAKAIKSTNATTGFVTITGYNYNIVFKDITFQKPSGPQTESKFIFGNYNTTKSPLAFGFDQRVNKSTCTTADNRIFNFSGNEALLLDILDYASLFPNEVTTTPRTALISSNNKLKYLLYSGTINNADFCSIILPSTPALTEQWDAINGVDMVSGIIEVTTITSGTGVGFQHTIHLKNVTFKKRNTTFNLGTDYTYGSFETNP